MSRIVSAYNVIPKDLQPGDLAPMHIVAVVYRGGFWAAYKMEQAESAQTIAEDGDKLPEAVACELFPAFVWAGLNYNDD